MRRNLVFGLHCFARSALPPIPPAASVPSTLPAALPPRPVLRLYYWSSMCAEMLPKPPGTCKTPWDLVSIPCSRVSNSFSGIASVVFPGPLQAATDAGTACRVPAGACGCRDGWQPGADRPGLGQVAGGADIARPASDSAATRNTIAAGLLVASQNPLAQAQQRISGGGTGGVAGCGERDLAWGDTTGGSRRE